MSLYTNFARQLLNTPLLLARDAAQQIIDELMQDRARPAALAVSDIEVEEPDPGYDVVHGVAIISVQGVLVDTSSWLTEWFGMTGYDTIRGCLRTAAADPDVRAIVLHIDSPGGMVSGCFDTGDLIRSLRGAKPIWAILDDSAYSAAYLLAAAADHITAPRAGGAGSIGVITILPDLSRMFDQAGITVNMISFGDAKTDGYPYAPLSDDARARTQANINAMGEMFVAHVAECRAIPAKAVRGTQAACLLAADALELGLIDAVATSDAAFASLLATLS